jgi:hypothetical protein
MTDDLRTRLSTEIHRVDWKPLAPHAKRGGLVLVACELDLIDVGAAVAGDDGQQVEKWMEARQLRRPTEVELEAWRDESGERFSVLIIQPYVLVQRVDFGAEGT